MADERTDLIEAACEAEELFDLDDLERHAAALRGTAGKEQRDAGD